MCAPGGPPLLAAQSLDALQGPPGATHQPALFLGRSGVRGAWRGRWFPEPRRLNMAAGRDGGGGGPLTVFVYDRRQEGSDGDDDGEKALACQDQSYEGFRGAVCQVTASRAEGAPVRRHL